MAVALVEQVARLVGDADVDVQVGERRRSVVDVNVGHVIVLSAKCEPVAFIAERVGERVLADAVAAQLDRFVEDVGPALVVMVLLDHQQTAGDVLFLARSDLGSAVVGPVPDLVLVAALEIVVGHELLCVRHLIVVLSVVFLVDALVAATWSDGRVEFQAQDERDGRHCEHDRHDRDAVARHLFPVFLVTDLETETLDAQVSDGVVAIPFAVDDLVVVEDFFLVLVHLFLASFSLGRFARFARFRRFRRLGGA